METKSELTKEEKIQQGSDMLAFVSVVNQGGYNDPLGLTKEQSAALYERYGISALAQAAIAAKNMLLINSTPATADAAREAAEKFRDAAKNILLAELNTPEINNAYIARRLLKPVDTPNPSEFLVVYNSHSGIMDLVFPGNAISPNEGYLYKGETDSTATLAPYYLPDALDLKYGSALSESERLIPSPYHTSTHASGPETTTLSDLCLIMREAYSPSNPVNSVRVLTASQFNPTDEYLEQCSIDIMKYDRSLSLEFDITNFFEQNPDLKKNLELGLDGIYARMTGLNGETYDAIMSFPDQTHSREATLIKLPRYGENESVLTAPLRDDESIESQFDRIGNSLAGLECIMTASEVAEIRKEIDRYEKTFHNMPIFEFPSGDYRYFNIDKDFLEIQLGGATNAGFYRDWNLPVFPLEPGKSIDQHLEALYELALEQNPELAQEPDIDESEEEQESNTRRFGR